MFITKGGLLASFGFFVLAFGFGVFGGITTVSLDGGDLGFWDEMSVRGSGAGIFVLTGVFLLIGGAIVSAIEDEGQRSAERQAQAIEYVRRPDTSQR